MTLHLATLRKIIILLCVGLGLTVLVLAGLAWKVAHDQVAMKAIPDYGPVPAFSLTERSGRTVTLADLKGDVWIGDFIFTTCPGPCPLMTAQMKRLQDELQGKPNVRLVSVTVDPETDTPAVLSRYADSFGANHQRWLFLTGTRQAIQSLARDGLHLTVEINTGVSAIPGQGPIVHSTRFVLVDQRGELRGYYDSDDNDSMQQLLHDVDRLRGEKHS